MSAREYLIWSIENDAFWRPARGGYTKALREAGRYSFVEATEILTRTNFVRVNECLIPVECVAPYPPVTSGERELLHELLESACAVIDPEQHPDLIERMDAVLNLCDEVGRCVPAEPCPDCGAYGCQIPRPHKAV